MYGIVLILTVVLMGGAIAYIGDKLGTKVGKRKLSMFGLRPKHTSIIVTIITGILISALTMGLLTLSSKNVRAALFNMESIRAELASLSAEVAGKTAELAAARTALEEKNKEFSDLNDQVNEMTNKLRSVTAELTTVLAERDRISADLARVKTQFEAAQGDLAKAKADMQKLQALKNELDAKVLDLTQSKETLEQDVSRLNDLTVSLSQHMQTIKQGVLVYRAGEVLNRGIVPSGLTQTEATEALKALFSQTNQLLLDKYGIKDKDAEVLWVSQADFEQAVSQVQQSGLPTVVRLSASGNTVYGEPVVGKIELFPNRLIYLPKSVVYSEVVAVGSTQSQTEEAFLAFLKNVNAAAVKQGILPDPLQGTVGVMSGAQLYDTVNQMRRLGPNVKLIALADGEVYTMGPLKLLVEVEEAK